MDHLLGLIKVFDVEIGILKIRAFFTVSLHIGAIVPVENPALLKTCGREFLSDGLSQNYACIRDT